MVEFPSLQGSEILLEQSQGEEMGILSLNWKESWSVVG